MTWTKEPPTKEGEYWKWDSRRLANGARCKPEFVRLFYMERAGFAFTSGPNLHLVDNLPSGTYWHPATPPELPTEGDKNVD